MSNKLKSYNKYINTFKYHLILAFPINIMQLICSFYSMQVIDRVLSNSTNDELLEEIADEVNDMMSERAIFVY